MSSVLDALTPDEQALVRETLGYHRLKRDLVRYGLEQILLQRLVRQVPIANPGAGADFGVTVPSGSTWDLLSLTMLLATSAVVADRLDQIIIKDQDGTVQIIVYVGQSQPASEAVRHVYSTGFGTTSTSIVLVQSLPSPPAILREGWSLHSLTGNLDAGDQYTQVMLTVREWNPLRVVSTAENLLADLDSAGGIPYAPII